MYRCFWLKNKNRKEKQLVSPFSAQVGTEINKVFIPIYWTKRCITTTQEGDISVMMLNFKIFSQPCVYLLFSRLRKNLGCPEVSTTRRLS